MTKRSETNHTAESLKTGDKLMCNGYEGRVHKICEGQLKGMIEVKLASGICCVSLTELIRFQNNAATFNKEYGCML